MVQDLRHSAGIDYTSKLIFLDGAVAHIADTDFASLIVFAKPKWAFRSLFRGTARTELSYRNSRLERKGEQEL